MPTWKGKLKGGKGGRGLSRQPSAKERFTEAQNQGDRRKNLAKNGRQMSWAMERVLEGERDRSERNLACQRDLVAEVVHDYVNKASYTAEQDQGDRRNQFTQNGRQMSWAMEKHLEGARDRSRSRSRNDRVQESEQMKLAMNESRLEMMRGNDIVHSAAGRRCSMVGEEDDDDDTDNEALKLAIEESLVDKKHDVTRSEVEEVDDIRKSFEASMSIENEVDIEEEERLAHEEALEEFRKARRWVKK